jgi:hypothetical protein
MVEAHSVTLPPSECDRWGPRSPAPPPPEHWGRLLILLDLNGFAFCGTERLRGPSILGTRRSSCGSRGRIGSQQGVVAGLACGYFRPAGSAGDLHRDTVEGQPDGLTPGGDGRGSTVGAVLQGVIYRDQPALRPLRVRRTLVAAAGASESARPEEATMTSASRCRGRPSSQNCAERDFARGSP